MLKDVQQEARRRIAEKFSKAGVRPMDISDLYERDENTGRVTFRNPDDPDRPFASRYEADQWCDSINKQINAKFRQEVANEIQKLTKDLAPRLNLLDFAPQWQQMSDEEKEMFDVLIEPYAIVDENSGDVIGFNCNLQAAARQATAICQKFNSRQSQGFQQAAQQAPQRKQRQQQPSMPAFDAKTGNGAGDDDEPKTLEEAMLALRKGRK